MRGENNVVLSKEAFQKTVKEFSNLLIVEEDAAEALWFAVAVIDAEINATKDKCPYATASIDRLEKARHELRSLARDCENEEFSEEG